MTCNNTKEECQYKECFIDEHLKQVCFYHANQNASKRNEQPSITKPYIILLNGTLCVIELPEKPKATDYRSVYCYDKLDSFAYKLANNAYNLARSAAIENKIEVENVTLEGSDKAGYRVWKLDDDNYGFIKEGEDILWPGTYKILPESRPIPETEEDAKIAAHEDRNELYHPERVKKVARLIAPEQKEKLIGRIFDDFENKKEIFIREPQPGPQLLPSEKQEVPLTFDQDLAVEVVARFAGKTSRGTPIAKEAFIRGASWVYDKYVKLLPLAQSDQEEIVDSLLFLLRSVPEDSLKHTILQRFTITRKPQ